MKICGKCKLEKTEDEFYWNSTNNCLMSWCKKCHISHTAERVKRIGYYKRPYVLEKQRIKNRSAEKILKNHLYYENVAKLKNYTKTYRLRYPEVVLAQTASETIEKPKGMEKHHWSYNPEHYRDVIFLPKYEHRMIHKRMIYIQDILFYKTQDGILLDTKEKHQNYIDSILS